MAWWCVSDGCEIEGLIHSSAPCGRRWTLSAFGFFDVVFHLHITNLSLCSKCFLQAVFPIWCGEAVILVEAAAVEQHVCWKPLSVPSTSWSEGSLISFHFRLVFRCFDQRWSSSGMLLKSLLEYTHSLWNLYSGTKGFLLLSEKSRWVISELHTKSVWSLVYVRSLNRLWTTKFCTQGALWWKKMWRLILSEWWTKLKCPNLPQNYTWLQPGTKTVCSLFGPQCHTVTGSFLISRLASS